MRQHAIGIVVKDRFDYTEKTLDSLYYADQDKNAYDLFLIDNGSSPATQEKLRRYAQSGLVPVKNLIITPEVSVPQAWNLFLALTAQYSYRTKMDNDIVLGGTLLIPEKKTDIAGRIIDSPSPADVDPKAGAPLSGVVIKGVGQAARAKTMARPPKIHSCFLLHMSEFSEQYNVDVVSLVPVAKGQNFATMHELLVRKPDPCLVGHCMMITRKAFETLGYFDERLPRQVDIDYTKRAIKSKLNIGYHPFYGIIHLGHDKPTEGTSLYNQRIAAASQILATPVSAPVPSAWTEYMPEIEKECSNHKIVSLI